MHTQSFPRTMILALLVVLAALPAAAQATADVQKNWTDFIHYIRVARPEVAIAYGQALLADDADANAIYRLSVETRGADKALAQAANMPELAEIVAGIRAKVEAGYRLESRSPENIAQALDLLAGHARQMAIAKQRLQQSGEYAVPQMIRALESTESQLLKDRISETLGLLGKDAVRPLCEALNSPDPLVRQRVCEALGRIGYLHAAASLKARLADAEEVGPVKEAAEYALAKILADTKSELTVDSPLAEFCYRLGQIYYEGVESVLPTRSFAVANVWRWEPNLGVTYTEVPEEIFLDVYAMRSARAALDADRSYAAAVTLWLRANLRKEADLPAGAVDPTRGAEQLGADAYAAAAGAGYMMRVLSASLTAGETEVVKDAVRALAGVAGAHNLLIEDQESPLVSALTYPDRRVRMMAADVLAQARPVKAFKGSDLVVSGLIIALRQTGDRTVLVVEPDNNQLNRYKDFVRAAGYGAINGDALASGIAAVEAAGGADLIVLSTAVNGPDAEGALAMLRLNPLTQVLPVVIVADMPSMVMAKRMVRNDPLALIVETESLDQPLLADALNRADMLALGGEDVTADEARQWMLRSAADIRLLGVSRCEKVFDLVRAEAALTAGLAHADNEVKVACARALAVVPSGTAQQAVAGLAASADDETVRVQAYLAAAESVRIFDRQLTDAQSQAVIDVVKFTGSTAIRNAASELLGALNLPSEQIKGLIIDRN